MACLFNFIVPAQGSCFYLQRFLARGHLQKSALCIFKCMHRMDRWIEDSLISKLAAKMCFQILRNAQIVSSHDPHIVLRVAHAIDSAQILPFARRRSTSWGLTTLRRVPRATTSARPTWPRSVWRIAMRRCATSSTLSRRASKTEWRLQSPQ